MFDLLCFVVALRGANSMCYRKSNQRYIAQVPSSGKATAPALHMRLADGPQSVKIAIWKTVEITLAWPARSGWTKLLLSLL